MTPHDRRPHARHRRALRRAGGTRSDAVARWTASAAVSLALSGLALVPGVGEAAWNASEVSPGTYSAGTYDSAKSYPTKILASQPTAYWRLDETSGTTVNDAAPFTDGPAKTGVYPGSYRNGPTLGQSPALPYQTRTSVRFDGVDDYVEVPDPLGPLDFSSWQPFTVEMWVYPERRNDNTERYERLVSKQYQDGGQIRGWSVNLQRLSNPERVTVQFERVSGQVTSANVQLPFDTWSHVAVVYENDRWMRIYVDGTLRGTSSSQSNDQLPDTTYPLTLGARWVGWGNAPADHFRGRLDDVSVYWWAMPGSQVNEHAKAPG